ncbi:MAG TPA: potassium transporter TrkG [Bacillota bacterium]|nr:potassium transporter TrkG [Bacillota bacterium]
MNYPLILYSLGNLLKLLAVTMLLPIMIALKDRTTDAQALFWAMVLTLLVGLLLTLFKSEGKFGRREGFVIVGLGWVLIAAFGALPFYFSGAVHSYVDAYFETMSGFTTTGSTILTEIESLPRGILLWRSLTHWLGGMGIIVLSVAIFSIFGKGTTLFQAEVPGLTEERLLPRLKHTAFILWLIYTILSFVQIIALTVVGMPLFDSVIHTFGSMATGGFSSRNISVEAYQSVPVEMIITFFMMLAGINFALYYRIAEKRSLKPLIHDPETKGYLLILGLATGLVALSLMLGMKQPFWEALRLAVFQVVSICTTTGFSSDDFALWPQFAQAVLFILMFIGGCTGSTGGAIKVARIVLLVKYMKKTVQRVARPRMIIQTKLGDHHIPDSMMHDVLAFFFMYMLLFVVGALIIAATGLDLVSSFTAAAGTLGNIGPGLGKVGPLSNFAFTHPIAKWVMSFLMLAGRLEILTVMVMFSPSFWRR